MQVSRLSKQAFAKVWPIFHSVLVQGETYALPPDINEEQAAELWCTGERMAYIAEEGGKVIGTFYLRPNLYGPGAHVANGGIMINQELRGQGYGNKLGAYMVEEARRLGFRSIQFNNVVETNTASQAIWKQLGFDVIGKIPEAFTHPKHGLVGSFILYKKL